MDSKKKKKTKDADKPAAATGERPSDLADAVVPGSFAVRNPRRFSLANVDLGKSLPAADYEAALAEAQHRIRNLQLAFLYSKLTGVIVLEGWDAAGKGGVIRRLTAPMDPRAVNVWPIGAPDQRELSEHYLQRFWRRLPPRGELAIFDRSWYGRVLVERVEGLTEAERWERAYGEIVNFEKSLTANGVRLVKIFLHVSPDAQAARFRERLMDPLKRWKLTGNDLRNLKLREPYETAVQDMVAKTSTRELPWHVIPADDKKFARIAAMRTIIDALNEGVMFEAPRPDTSLLEEAWAQLNLSPEDLAKVLP